MLGPGVIHLAPKSSKCVHGYGSISSSRALKMEGLQHVCSLALAAASHGRLTRFITLHTRCPSAIIPRPIQSKVQVDQNVG